MENEPKNIILDSVYQLFKAVQKDNITYIYHGYFDRHITESILSLAEANIVKKKEKSSVKKRVYHIMVESLQNITRHQSVRRNEQDENSGVFFVQYKEQRYFVTTGNLIKNALIPELKAKIDKVNSYTKEELKEYYRNVLIYGELSEKGGAGLGLIDMARKSGNKLLYNFKKVDDEFSYFYMHSAIPTNKQSESDEKIQKLYSLEYISILHSLLNKNNILVIFNTYFNQHGLLNLVSIVEGHLAGSKGLRYKILNIMVEMFQNIVHHGISEKNDGSGNPGMFFISETEEKYLLNTGNYLFAEDAEKLKLKLDNLNAMNEEELEDYYNKRLFDFAEETSISAGLGFIDIRTKSQNKLNFDFHRVNEKISFFSLQVGIFKPEMKE